MVRLVVMAAGQATRMGQDKLALPWADSTVLERNLGTVIQAAHSVNQPSSFLFYSNLATSEQDQESGLLEVVVVARRPIEEYCSAATIESFRTIGGTWLIRDGFYPLADNIHAGLDELSLELDGVGFLPADQVGVDDRQLVDLVRHFVQLSPDFLVPCTGDTLGSPVFFHRRYLPELLGLEGDQGGKSILQRYSDKLTKHMVTSEFFDDIDSPQDYVRLKTD